jgi:SAM-dependent methyltransferase
MSKQWTADEILQLARSYQSACVLAAAVDLDLFECLAAGSATAEGIAKTLQCDRRATTTLLDSLVALELLHKEGERYSVPESLVPILARDGPGSVLSMAQHQANCLRRWAQLARVVRSGQPAGREPSIRGDEADMRAFIGAMHVVSAPVADEVIRHVKPLAYHRVLDVGGASGTWTAALLKACPGSSAILFDLPEVIPLARVRLASLRLSDRVQFVAGDYLKDALPAGVDLAWVSAIVHQNSREQNRCLFAAALHALDPGGHIAIRDILMEPSRTSPAAGSLFAVNMLVATTGGGTYTFEELRADLESAGFTEVACPRRDAWMNSLVTGKKPRVGSSG